MLEALASFTAAPGAPRELTAESIARIDRIFALDSVEAIFTALEADQSDWARAQLATLQTKSPQTLKVAFRQLREGAAMAELRRRNGPRISHCLPGRLSAMISSKACAL